MRNFYKREKNTEKQLSLVGKEIKYFGPNTDRLTRMSNLYMGLGKIEQAKEMWLKELERDSLNAIALDSTGATTLSFAIPSSTTLLGATVFGQAVAPDPKANATGAATTNAFKAVVGI